jgi:hypothetical protein
MGEETPTVTPPIGEQAGCVNFWGIVFAGVTALHAVETAGLLWQAATGVQ